MSSDPVKVLYLGMATDIMAPLILVPDLDIIYVMNVLDTEFGGSWEQHKTKIITILEQGSDEGIKNPDRDYPPKSNNPIKDIHTLEGPSKIISNTDDSKIHLDAKWELEFIYNGKTRKLIYYHEFNFAYIEYEWPKEINSISHILWNGSYCWDFLMEDDCDSKMVRKMMSERMLPEAYLYALSFNHKWFPEHIWIYDGHELDGHSIAKLKVNFTKPDWWKQGSNNVA